MRGASRVFLLNAALTVPVVLWSVPLVAPVIALCPSYPPTAWLAADRWLQPGLRFIVTPLVGGLLGSLLYRRLRRLGPAAPATATVRWAAWGIAFAFVAAWALGSVDAALQAAGRLSVADLPLVISALVSAPLALSGYTRAARCGGGAALVLVLGGLAFGVANGLLVRWSSPAPVIAVPVKPQRRAWSRHALGMAWTAAVAAAILAGLWAHDYLRLAFYVVPVVTLAPHSLGEMGSYSPDGTKILHVREGAIYVMDADGANPVRLTGGEPRATRPAYSPDGKTIVYVSDFSRLESDGGRLYVMDADGRGSRRLGAGDPDLWGVDYPVFSPDGSKIACTVHGGRSIYLLDADGGRGATIVTLARIEDLSFSPDGSTLLFTSAFGSAGMRAGMYLTSLDGTRRAPVGDAGSAPSFSRDGRRIVYHRATLDGRSLLVVIGPDVSNHRTVASLPFQGWEVAPRFSPDGSRILFGGGPRHDQGLYVVGADGGEVRRVSPHYRGAFARFAPAIAAGAALVIVALAGLRLAAARAP